MLAFVEKSRQKNNSTICSWWSPCTRRIHCKIIDFSNPAPCCEKERHSQDVLTADWDAFSGRVVHVSKPMGKSAEGKHAVTLSGNTFTIEAYETIAAHTTQKTARLFRSGSTLKTLSSRPSRNNHFRRKTILFVILSDPTHSVSRRPSPPGPAFVLLHRQTRLALARLSASLHDTRSNGLTRERGKSKTDHPPQQSKSARSSPPRPAPPVLPSLPHFLPASLPALHLAGTRLPAKPVRSTDLPTRGSTRLTKRSTGSTQAVACVCTANELASS